MRAANNKIYFSQIEKVDLLKAWLAISIAFAIFFWAGGGYETIVFSEFIFIATIAAITAGTGFILHELAHKFTAHHFGVHSEFRSHDMMLVLAIIIAFLGIIFAAPGAVYMTANVTRRESGIISAAGPIANIILAIGFLAVFLTAAKNTLLYSIGSYGLFINAFLAMFNMIPLGDFDGLKIFKWSKTAYFIMATISVALVIGAFILIENLTI